ncbi:hypothetical protein OK015_27110 [Mycobacterium sp. Aquia_216]|uniref:hypothetical protein n=1 Tax=Mycobacterium sp. Aquia_216 TaxID=2991729 RepID=UPI00227CB43E|nr:hypothetical protein [Mycobacterium sp. Aquia_216]WAJ44726.1 hypothetical protein OK015_27110 [Mycobacterium sp. Aquia_216]
MVATWGIIFAPKELGDPSNDSAQGASGSLGFLDPVVGLLSFFGVIVDGFVAFFCAHAYLHLVASRVVCRRVTIGPICRASRERGAGVSRSGIAPSFHTPDRFNVVYPPGRCIKTARFRRAAVRLGKFGERADPLAVAVFIACSPAPKTAPPQEVSSPTRRWRT